MNLLVTNDDGIASPFLHELVAALLADGHTVAVVAPKTEQSWTGAAKTRHRPVHATRLESSLALPCPTWTVDGTPSDCVNIALGHLLPSRPDIVISGINIGFNATMPLCLSSGTLAGATEGAAWGLPAVACSLDLEQALFEQVHRNSAVCPPALRPHLETACRHAARFARGIVGQPVTGLHVHSLNYPAGVTEQTAMERSTPALVRHGSLFKRSALGFAFAWNDGEDYSAEEQTDLAVLERGLISHTVFDFGGVAPL